MLRWTGLENPSLVPEPIHQQREGIVLVVGVWRRRVCYLHSLGVLRGPDARGDVRLGKMEIGGGGSIHMGGSVLVPCARQVGLQRRSYRRFLVSRKGLREGRGGY
jgi:hypothetical protein